MVLSEFLDLAEQPEVRERTESRGEADNHRCLERCSSRSNLVHVPPTGIAGVLDVTGPATLRAHHGTYEDEKDFRELVLYQWGDINNLQKHRDGPPFSPIKRARLHTSLDAFLGKVRCRRLFGTAAFVSGNGVPARTTPQGDDVALAAPPLIKAAGKRGFSAD
ncbi:hypothetical protein MRX96_058311 [Rhipicephalus microplus]